MKRHAALALLGGLLLLGQPTRAQQGTDADRAATWQELKHAVYGDRPCRTVPT
jgi:hypothetical protein